METKSIWTSKTLWVNLIAGIAMLVQSKYGFVIDAEAQAAALTFINIILRLITKKAIDFKGQDKKIITGLILIITSGMIVSCSAARMENNVFKTLSVSQVTYDSALSTVGDLYKQGKLSEDTKQEIIEKAREYKQAHNTAVSAFLKYKESGLLDDEEDYLTKFAKASSLLAEFIRLAKPYIEKGENQ